MAKGFPNMGGKNMNNMMKQVQKLQKDMEKMQADLDKQEFESSAGGGVVTAKVNGKQELIDLTIDSDVVDPDDVETLEDLILVAIQGAMNAAKEKTEGEMSRLTGGLNIPGMF